MPSASRPSLRPKNVFEPASASGTDGLGAETCSNEPGDLAAAVPLAPHYARLGEPFHVSLAASPLQAPRLAHFNAALAEELGLPVDAPPALTAVLSGERPWPGYQATASVYAGHQFGAWVPQLGDGRALLVAEVRTPRGERRELQLKGSGTTPYSRGLDGRAALRSSIREYLCSEAMHALGVPTTRCVSLIASEEPVQRETTETAAVVCRVAPSFVRFGQFEYFAETGRPDALRRLADHVIAEFRPELVDHAERYALWLQQVVVNTAELIAQWQTLGFCHGVMNTDNFSVLGLTLDYGPFGFMDRFRQHHICNHSDYEGRYAYGAQPQIGQWNCSHLLRACLPLLDENPDAAREHAATLLEAYAPAYNRAVMRRWADKLGLIELRANDASLINGLLTAMQRDRRDFTLSFRHLATVPTDTDSAGNMAKLGEAVAAWTVDYRARLHAEQNTDDARRAERMNQVNPKYVLRNHLAQAAIEQAEAGDYAELARLFEVLSRPYEDQPGRDAYAAEPPAELRHLEVSCSS